MALDFHSSDTNEHLFGINDEQYNYLLPIFEAFEQWTGIFIDPYKHSYLSKENCVTLVKIIDKYIYQVDLNKDKKGIIEILGFRGLLKYFSDRNIDFLLQGD